MSRAGTKKMKGFQGMTAMEQSACLYLQATEEFNLTEACARAGYKNPNRAATALMKRPRVKKYLEELRRKREVRTQVTGDMIIAKLYQIVFKFNPVKYYPHNGDGWHRVKNLHDMPEEHQVLVTEIDVRSVAVTKRNEEGRLVTVREPYTLVKFMDKNNAVNILARHLLPQTRHYKGVIGTIALGDGQLAGLPPDFYDRMCEMPKDPDPIEQLLEGPD